MNRQLTLQQYRTIDLLLFAAMLALFEFLIVRFATGSMFGTVSLAAALTAIVYMRWGWWGGLHAALAGALFCFYLSLAPSAVQIIGWNDYLTYIVGNLFSLLAVAGLEALGKERVRQSVWLSLGFALAVIVLMQGGRMLVALTLGCPPEELVRSYFLYDCLSILFTLVIIWIVRRLDGVFEDQRHYLLRLQEERERNNTEQ